MKIAIIGITDLFNMPYYKTYKTILEQRGIECHIINWSRRDIKNIKSYDNLYTFKYVLDDLVPIYKKIIPMYRYANYVKRITTKNEYDYLIILSPLLAVLMSSYLKSKYKNKYLVDIRDFSYESIWLYRELEKNVLKNANLRVVSSPGFRSFVPSDNLIVCHNMNYTSAKNRIIQRYNKLESNRPLCIGYIGLIQYLPQVKRFIDAFSNNSRFLIKICGEGSEAVQEYCDSKGIWNVECTGRYKPEEKQEIYSTFHVVYNAYGNQNPLLDYALSNKLYESAWNGLPIIVNENTMMEKYAGYMGFPIDGGVEPHEMDLPEKLLNWYLNINWKDFDKAAYELLNDSINENHSFKEKLITNIEATDNSTW